MNNIFYNLTIINDIDINNNITTNINENNFDSNYLASSSSQSTLIINTVTTTATTQVNNDFCNISENISETTTFSYHNLIRRYDNKFAFSTRQHHQKRDLRQPSVQQSTMTTSTSSLVETLQTPSVQQSTMTTLTSSWASTSTPTVRQAEASYNGVIGEGEERYNTNEETTEENSDFIVTTSSTVGGVAVKEPSHQEGVSTIQRSSNCATARLKRIMENDAQEAATRQRQLWWQSIDLTATVNDHAWTATQRQ